MPSFSFQTRFVPFVKDGTKRQTIRKIRKHAPRPGQLISAFTGSRFKPVPILDEKPECLSVESIFILPSGEVLIAHNQPPVTEVEAKMIIEYLEKIGPLCETNNIAGTVLQKLTDKEKDELAWQDGFRWEEYPQHRKNCFEIMREWWSQTHSLPFAGHIIKW